jgi:membrane protein required for colicin V production
MYWIDISILVLLLLSTLIAVVRGFVKEAISLATWVAAFFISMSFSPKLVTILPEVISAPLLRQGVAWFLLFLATMIVGGLISFIISSMVDKTGLSHTDRALGTLFGLARGVVIICVLVLLGAYMELPKTDWWMQAKLLPYFQSLTEWTVALMPDDIAKKFIFK